MTEPKRPAALPAALDAMLTPARLTAAFAATSLVIVLLMFPAPLGGLEAVLFNYANNTLQPRPVFYFNGWIHLVPEIVAYLARGLPVMIQFAIYPAVAIAFAVIMAIETRKLLGLWVDEVTAAMLALVVLLYFQFYMPTLNLLVWSIWPLAIAACCHILRRNCAGEPFTWTGLAATAAACLSNPTTAVLVPLLCFFGLRARSSRLRRQDLALAGLLVLYFGVMTAAKPGEAHYVTANPISDATIVWEQLKQPAWGTLPAAVAALALVCLSVAVLIARSISGSARVAVLALAYIGLASLALYVVSGRGSITRIQPRYTVVCVVAALLATSILAARLGSGARRVLIAAIALAVVASELTAAAKRLRLSIHMTKEQLVFARAADAFRRTCRPDEAMALNATAGSPIVLCTGLDGTLPTDASRIARTDMFSNVFVYGPTAVIRGTEETTPTEILVPRR